MDKKTGLITTVLALAGACGTTQAVTQAPEEQAPIAEHETEMDSGFGAYCIAEQQPRYTVMHIFTEANFSDRNGIDEMGLRAYPGQQDVLRDNQPGLGYPHAGLNVTRFDVMVRGQVDSLAMYVRDRNGNNAEFTVPRIDCRSLAELVLINEYDRALFQLNLMREWQQYNMPLPSNSALP